ncbi:MAG: hypothetical protein AAFY46_03570 [Planctomycetota bacterium]
MDDRTAALSQTTAAMLLLAVIIVIATGALATFLILRNHYRRQLPKPKSKQRPSTPDPWAESARRLGIPEDNSDDDPDDDDPDDDDDDGDEDASPPPVPSSPSMSASC